MTFQHRPDDYGMGFGSSLDAGLGDNAGLGHSNGYGSNSGLGRSSGGNHIYSKWGTGGLGWSGGMGNSGGLRESRSAKWAKFLTTGSTSSGKINRSADRSRSGSASDDMSGLGGGDLGGLGGSGGGGCSGLSGLGLEDSKREVVVPASHPVHPPVLLDNLDKLEKARHRVFKGLDKNGDGAILAIFDRKWFKRLQQLCDHLGAQGNAVGGLLAHTTALPSPGLNIALQDWMAAVTNNLYTLHSEMESVSVQRIILIASDIGDASDMADAVGSGDPSEIVDTAGGITVNDAAQDACEEIFGRVDGPLARCYKTLVQRAAEMDNRMMPALHHELSGGGWNVPPGPGRW
ncbi:hypothetical protein Sste5346_008213 [Sporothrix stenoceras]|uniref:Uncharacterized protein n=1 Tax=Sporothrix stenoceras TaxID=5173 RepID=A0ABR3YQ97_9PEZI